MNVQLKELFDIIGERKTIDYSITADKLLEYVGYSFASPVAVTGEIENRAGVVTLRFKTVFTMDHTCDRCLKEFSYFLPNISDVFGDSMTLNTLW